MKLNTSFEFDAAHRLVGYKGKCSNLHGHIWRVEIEIEGEELDDVGILWDFTNVKKLKEKFDHKTILKDCKENDDLIKCLWKVCGVDSVALMNDNPTAEHLAEMICRLIKEPKLSKVEVKVYESPKSCADFVIENLKINNINKEIN